MVRSGVCGSEPAGGWGELVRRDRLLLLVVPVRRSGVSIADRGRNGKKPARAATTPRFIHGANRRPAVSPTTRVNGQRPVLRVNALQTATDSTTWATTFMNGAWTGMGLTIIGSPTDRIPKVPPRASGASRGAVPGGTPSKRPGPLTAAAFRPISDTRITASGSPTIRTEFSGSQPILLRESSVAPCSALL